MEKWQLALDMIDEARSRGVDVSLVVADAGYGDATAFRSGLKERGLAYAVGVSVRHSAHPADARPVQPDYAGAGQPPKMRYPDPPQTMKHLVVAAGKTAGRPVSWREGSRPGKGRSGFKRMHSKTRWRTEPLPSRPRTADTPRPMDRRLPHLPPRHTHPHTNLAKPY